MSVEELVEGHHSEGENGDPKDYEETLTDDDNEPDQVDTRQAESREGLSVVSNCDRRKRRPCNKRSLSTDSATSAPNPLREHPVEAPDGSPPRSSLLKRRRFNDESIDVMVYRRANGDVVTRRMTTFAF